MVIFPCRYGDPGLSSSDQHVLSGVDPKFCTSEGDNSILRQNLSWESFGWTVIIGASLEAMLLETLRHFHMIFRLIEPEERNSSYFS